MIKKFASWNSYPKNIVNAIIKCVLSEETLTNDVISNQQKDKIPTVFINIDCPGEKGEHLLKKSFKKLGRSLSKKLISFVVILSRKYCFSLIGNISSISLVNLMLFMSFHYLFVNLPILEKLSKHSLKEQNNL